MKFSSYWSNYGGGGRAGECKLCWMTVSWAGEHGSINNDSKTKMNKFLLKRLDLVLLDWNFEIQHIIVYSVMRAVQSTALAQNIFWNHEARNQKYERQKIVSYFESNIIQTKECVWLSETNLADPGLRNLYSLPGLKPLKESALSIHPL